MAITRNINDDNTLAYLFNKANGSPQKQAQFKTINGWDVVEWENGLIEAQKHFSGTMTSYAVVGSCFGYYTTITFPMEMKNNDYFISQTWQVGEGFTWSGATLARTKTSAGIYAVASQSGTQHYDCWIYLRGYKA